MSSFHPKLPQPTPWLKKSVIAAITLFIILLCNLQNIKNLVHHQYYVYEQDAYMHLVIASDLLKTGDWYQHFNPRLNAPWGTDTHSWTRAITALLASGALLLSLFMPLTTALYVWSFWLPLIFYALAAWTMLWVLKALKPSTSQQLFVLLAFLFNPFINTFFIPLRVDYDFLLIFLSIVYWGVLLRFIQTGGRNFAIITAVVASLATWTSISFLLPLFIGIGFLFWLVLVKQKIAPQPVAILLLGICIGFAVVIRLEHRQFITVAYDIISIVHLIFFLFLTLSFTLYVKFFNDKKMTSKLLFILVNTVIFFGAMNVIFPGFYRGPYNQVDPYLLQHFFPTLSEFYSPFSIDPSLTLAIISYFLIGGGYCYYLYLSRPLSIEILFFLWATIVTTLLTIYMYRWVGFAIPVSIILASLVMNEVKDKSRGMQFIWVAIMSLLPFLISLTIKDYFIDPQQLCLQQFHSMLKDKFLENPRFTNDKTIFIHSNYGPLLLYSTQYSIVATNDHHNPQGLKDTIRFFKANEKEARQIIQRRKIDLILLCPLEHPTQFNPKTSPWLKRISLPPTYSQWQLYQPISSSN
ncbi:hypothetical protein [Legionella jamestowniensis]|uniref:Glycosyltransferase RgtA/B/C/D-like domain-containing protein n=1 Tax=Legionella jamestowniensis TaxID=455 RepID=A0A0W0UH36_9GAMM|nr:hypothetical protein [Legionella jamestowniensis]KTD07130.1 hypothetical protein Ljam_1325 [Legionella jamestowniensis]SFL71371.1 hypothetical protein SAMN02746073_1568 [Legionella jamestowniensis DSM 19215]